MLLRLKDVIKTYPGASGPVDVLRGVGLALEAGQSLALTGESGSGKSTLLHLAAGLDAADGGRVEVKGIDLGQLGDSGRARLRRGEIGLIFQQFNLIPSLTVAANLAFQARLAGRDEPHRIAQLAEALGLTEQMAKYPEHLSGGQQQRVAIGRTLAAAPNLILADEPTGNLDEGTGDTVLALMLELSRETGAGLLMVTHSERLAGQLDARLHLSKGRVQ